MTNKSDDDEDFIMDNIRYLIADMQNKLLKIRDLHSPIVPPEGMVLIGSDPGELYCAGCDCGDPYDATPWPCETREICDEGTDYEETRHEIEFRQRDYTIKHPLSCRPNLFDCPQPGPTEGRRWTLGRFYCGMDDEGNFVLLNERKTKQ